MAFIYDLTDTWNAGGVTFNAIKMNVTDTASAAASRLVSLQVGGVERFGVRKDGQGYFADNVGIGTTSPGFRLDVQGSTSATSRINVLRTGSSGVGVQILSTGAIGGVAATNSGPFAVFTSDLERMRIDTSGRVLVATTAALDFTSTTTSGNQISSAGISISRSGAPSLNIQRSTNNGGVANFWRDTTNVGSISVTTTATTYNTSSDYRLKDIDGPIQNSGAYIDALKPVQGRWKADGSRFIGLLAHEVQEVSETQIATGEKDGEKMQAMDYSSPEIIANLIAEIQSLRAYVAELKGK
jgi:hypothetical protein